MKYILFLFCLFFGNPTYAQISTSGLLGEWKMVTKTPIGNRKQNFIFKIENEKLIGITKNGKVKITKINNELSWNNKVKTPLGAIDIFVTGKINEDGNIIGYSSPISGTMKGKKLNWIMEKKKLSK